MQMVISVRFIVLFLLQASLLTPVQTRDAEAEFRRSVLIPVHGIRTLRTQVRPK
jgi:hypothetical protein